MREMEAKIWGVWGGPVDVCRDGRQGVLPLGPGRETHQVQDPQSCPTLCNPMDYSPQGSSIHGFLQARILESVAMPSFRGIFPTQGYIWNQSVVPCPALTVAS